MRVVKGYVIIDVCEVTDEFVSVFLAKVIVAVLLYFIAFCYSVFHIQLFSSSVEIVCRRGHQQCLATAV